MATIASASTSYASAQDLIQRFDLRPIEQLLSDSGVPLALGSVPAFVDSILKEASGMLEAAATTGQRYIVGPSPAPTPAAPVLSTATTGGTVAAGAYLAAATLVNQIGESLPSPSATLTTTGTTSTLTLASPTSSLSLNATGWNAYVSQVGGTTLTLQNTTPLAVGTAFTLTAPPTSTGVNPPTTTVTPQNDLLQIAQSGSNSGEFLKGVVCAIAYMMIWERRPEWLGGDPEKAGFRVKLAMDTLDKLCAGQWVFGTIEAMEAGEMNDTIESEAVIIQQNRPTHVARRLFGPRVADIVGSNLPPHPYP